MAKIKGLVNKEAWKRYQRNNKDNYGRACVKVAENVMKFLDTFDGDFEIGYHPNLKTPHGIICHCDDQGGITGFMASAVRTMVTLCYRDGWKFFCADYLNLHSEESDKQKLIKKVINSELDVTEATVSNYIDQLSKGVNNG